MLQETVDQRRIQREISILRRLSHGCIIQLLEIVETEHFIYLVCDGHGSCRDYEPDNVLPYAYSPSQCITMCSTAHMCKHCTFLMQNDACLRTGIILPTWSIVHV